MHKILQHLVWYIVKSLIWTYRFEVQGKEHQDAARKVHPKGSFIFAVWHEQVVGVMAAHAWTEPYLALASRSKDGDYAAFVSQKMGFISVRGSSRKKQVDKGGKEAMQEYIQKMNQGICGGITVDGPKGPRQACKPGVVLIAKETGAPILPVIGLPLRYWEFNSWDRFKIPKPFSRIIIRYGAPISVKADSDQLSVEESCQEVTKALKNLHNN
jgi:lysophospholipid acyltransferase (LPLAT)-like uncharacterized protein